VNDLNKLYDLALKENIEIYDYNWNNALGRIFQIDNNYYIVLNERKIENSKQEKQTLAEELGHYYHDALYYINSSFMIKSKCEYRAQKWAYSTLIPIQKLKEKISEGLTNIFDLAEYFNVEPNYMNDCIHFYNEIGALT